MHLTQTQPKNKWLVYPKLTQLKKGMEQMIRMDNSRPQFDAEKWWLEQNATKERNWLEQSNLKGLKNGRQGNSLFPLQLTYCK